MNETKATDQRMTSAVDIWIAVVLLGSALLGIGATIFSIEVGGLFGLLIAVPLVLLPTTMLPLWMLLHTVYRLEADHILAISGPFRWRVPYRDIRSITRRRELTSGPALSMDRLVINHGPMGCWLIISPHDPEAFQQALQKRLSKTAKT